MSERYIPTLDGWRAVAILLVIGDHLFASALGTPSGRTTLPGQLGVNIFFGLSGFLITSRLLAEQSISLRRFYIRRAFRILPPALSYLAVLGTLGLLGLIPLYPRELLAAACFFRNYLPPNLPLGGGFYTWHFWSLAIEEHFYLFWPPLLKRVRGSALMVSIGIAIAGAAWRLIELLREGHRYGHTLVGFPWRTDIRIDALMCGAAVAIAYANPRARVWLSNRFEWVLAAVVYGLVVAHYGVRPTIWQSALIPILIAGTVARPRDPVGRVLDAAPIRWLGRLSYSLYLWQQLWLPPSWFPHTLGVAQTWPLNILCVLACATASYYLIERPSIRVGQRLAAAYEVPVSVGAIDAPDRRPELVIARPSGGIRGTLP
jgi:peptidoglycan/LPS O-acetylase OafA/YrhL